MPLIPLMAGPTEVSASATLSATSTLSVSGTRETSGAVSLASTTALSSSAIRTTDGTAALAAVPTLSADGIRVTSGAVSLGATAGLSAGAQLTAQAAVSLPMTASLSAEGTGIPSGGAGLIATPTLSLGVVATYFAATSLPATTSLSVSGGAILSGDVSLSVTSALTTNGTRITSGAVTLSSTVVLSSESARTTFGATTLSIIPVLTADGIRTTSGAVSLSVSTNLTSAAVRITSGASTLTATATLAAAGSLPSDTPPTVTAGRSRPVARGSTVVLDVIATPPGGQTIASHSWTIQSGGGSLTDAGTATPTYTPPGSGSGLAVIRDTVTASGGGSATADVTVSYHTNVVAAENALTGIARTTWDLPTANLGLAGIATLQGFADGFTVDHTQTVNFKIAQSDGAGWTANIYRLGYYGGLGARDYGPLNPSAGQLTTSQSQPTSLDVDPDTTLKSADCSNWSVSLTWTPPAWAPSGIYILKLNRTGGGTSHVMFILRDDSRAADLMFMPADSTWNAYNAFRDMGSGNWLQGNSLYFGIAVDQYNADCAHYVSYNRPFMNRAALTGGYGAVQWSTFFTAEYGMLRFVERNGIDVKYYGCIDAAGDSSGTLLKGNGSTVGGVKAGIFVGHNEYWSDGMRAGWESFKVAGGSVFSCAGNEVFWRLVGSNNDSAGRPRTWECQKSTINGRGNTRPQWTGTWRDPDGAGKGGNNPENQFTGTIFVVNGPDFHSVVVPVTGGYTAQPLWRHTTVAALGSGSYSSPGEIIGFEWDTYGPAGTNGTGGNFLATPHSRVRYCSTATYTVSGPLLLDAGDQYGSGYATHRLVVQPSSSNNGGITFGTGTVNWAFGVDNANTYQIGSDNVDIVLQQATINMFKDMGCNAATLMAGLTAPTAVDWFPSGATTLTVTPTLTAGASAVSVPGAATLAASATLSASGLRTTAGAVSLATAPTLTAAASLKAEAGVTLGVTPALTANAVRTTSGAAVLSAVPTLTAAISALTTTGVVNLGTLCTLTVGGAGVVSGASSLTTVGVLVANGTRWQIAATNLSSSQVLSISGGLTTFGSAQLSVSSSLSVDGQIGTFNLVGLGATGTLVIGVGVVSQFGAVALVVSGSLLGDLRLSLVATANLVATALLQHIDIFPKVEFSTSGRWNDHSSNVRGEWTTVGSRAASNGAW